MDRYRMVFDKLIRGLIEIYGLDLQQIVLYGSVARGTDTNDSDIDIAVFVNNDNEGRHDSMTDLNVDLELECGRCISIITIDPKEYTDWYSVSPFYMNVQKDGVVLWKAA